MPRHRREAAGPDGLAHCFVQQRGDNSAMQKPGMPLKLIGDRHRADYRAVFGKQKVELQPVRVGLTTSEATILSAMGQGSEIVEVRFHHRADPPASTRANTGVSTLPPVRTSPIRL